MTRCLKSLAGSPLLVWEYIVGAIQSGSVVPKPVVTALLERADRFSVEGQHDHASAFYRAAVAADLTPIAHIEYGIFLADSERDVAARKHLTEGWELAKQLQLPALRALACHNLATLHRRQGQLAAAESFQQLAIRAQLDADPLAPLPAYLLAGRALDLVANESVAADKLLQAAQMDPHEEVAGLLNSGVIAFRQERESLAIERFYWAFERAQSAKDLNACAAVLVNIAHLQRDRGRWSIADECMALAEKIEQEASRPRSALRIQNYRHELKRGLALLSADPSWN